MFVSNQGMFDQRAACSGRGLLITYKALNGKAPNYISDLLSFKDRRNTRFMQTVPLNVPKVKCPTFGGQGFCLCGPMLWNALPLSIRSAPKNVLEF